MIGERIRTMDYGAGFVNEAIHLLRKRKWAMVILDGVNRQRRQVPAKSNQRSGSRVIYFENALLGLAKLDTFAVHRFHRLKKFVLKETMQRRLSHIV
jgi:hypothetical protein